jgi:type 1 fimbria pilin
MSSFKLVCVAAAMVASVAATSAFADCTRSQEVALGQATTRAMAEKGGTQHQKQIVLHDCDATSDGSTSAAFTYHYYDEQGLQTVSGSVKANKDHVTSLNTGKSDSRVASRDDRDDYDDQSLGRYSYQ